MLLSDEEIEAYEKEVKKLSLDELKKRLNELPEYDSSDEQSLIEDRIDELLKEQAEKLEYDYQNTPHRMSFIIRAFCIILFVAGFLYPFVAGFLYPFVAGGSMMVVGITSLCSCTLFGIVAIIDKRFKLFSELYYEETHPNDYRTSVIATFLFGVFCFAMCMLT
ncbi:hypothetical protein SAMN05720761_11654 [Fibrobacter sp. UWCM]|uniref:hypothetical protein n=1 Tax=unclassified Fibrobacter TaxID=2634177 RepID=UPI00090F107E|nr:MULTISPECIES: hypothetical protein [unclassified Fibrobacter]MBR2058280.1 hypothetical protein [Fibrobacter sp.]MBR2307934.1 hypothetical protein [Fibrobacter sp.]MBR4006563.1 hypothetical protein [Fibrobacter sp.]SHH49782.1 hypothetical protein SAMN05720761_11654 [Fibrobacter sp. UWCM]